MKTMAEPFYQLEIKTANCYIEVLEVKAHANFEGQIGDKDDTWGSAKSTNEFAWQAIDAWKEPKQWGKFYFSKKD